MPNILCIETATKSCSVAIVCQNKVYLKEENLPNIHASSLTIFIENLLMEANIVIEKLDAVAVSIGPGSYTGLRIGLSTAKGICFALNKPLITIPTLEAMVAGFYRIYGKDLNNGFICPMIDARRMEVYCAMYDSHKNNIHNTTAKILDHQSFNTELTTNTVYFIGDGAEKCKDLFKSENAIIVSNFINSAQDLNELAQQKYFNKDFENIIYTEPLYLKEFQKPLNKPS